jgi:hypothetical protein
MYFVWASVALCRASEEWTEVRIGFPVEHHLQQMTATPLAIRCRLAAECAARQRSTRLFKFPHEID